MMPAAPDPETLDAQIALLATPIGGQGSGAARYAAAMYFYTYDMMPLNMLEIYRCCSNLDSEDPIELAEFEGVELPSIVAHYAWDLSA